MQNEFSKKQIELSSKGVAYECFKPDRYIDVIRYQNGVLGSILASPYVVEYYLNNFLYVRIPSLTLAESDRYVKLNHKQLNFFGASYFKMQDYLTKINDLAGESKKYIDDLQKG